MGYDASPAAVKNFLAYSLTRLGTDYVDLYQPARLDPQVPIEETVGAIAEMIQAGYVRYLGLSEMGAETIRRAHAGASGQRPADRVLADEPGHRGRASCPRSGSSASASRRTASCPAACSARRRPRSSAGSDSAAAVPPVPGREPAPQPGPARRAGADRGRARGDRAAARVRLGAVPRRGHHPADRHQAPGPAGRGARRAGPAAQRRTSWPAWRRPCRRARSRGTATTRPRWQPWTASARAGARPR